MRNTDGSLIAAFAEGQCFQLWRRADDRFGPCTTAPRLPWGMSDDASRIITTTHITDGTLNPLVAHGIEDDRQTVYELSRDGRYAYIATRRGLYKLDALTGITIELDSAFRIVSPIRLSQDGRTFFGVDNDVLLIGGAR